MQNLPAGLRSGTVPGKTYEYLASGRPILAAVPEGDTRDILLASGMAHVCAPDDAEAMAGAIETEASGSSLLSPTSPAFVEQFEYGNLAKRVSNLIEEVAMDRPRPQSRNGIRSTSGSAAPAMTAMRGLRRASANRRKGRVLMLAYYFPPIGGAGAQRSLKLARYLPEFGYDVTVITGAGTTANRWSPTDESLLAELPDTVDIRRIRQPEPPQAGHRRSRLERMARLESAWSKWWVGGLVELGLELEDEVDLILASMSPYNCAEAAVVLSERLGKPWVAGLRDPWALDEMMIYPTAVHRRLEMARMGRTLRTAAATVTTTPESARQIREAFPELRSALVTSIPNGYDSSDFEFEIEPRRDDKFVILHSGYLHTDIGRRWRGASHLRRALGGARVGADILTRSHVYILRAIDLVLERDPSLEGRLVLQLAGVLSESDRAATARSSYVHTLGYLPHHEAIGMMRSADLLFLPMQNLPPGVWSGTVPGKTYEYLASGRPILAAVPEGDARDLLIQAGTAQICEPDDVEAMADALERAIARWRDDEPTPAVNEDLLRSFERSSLTAEFAAVLDAVTGRLVPETARALARLSA